MKPRHQRLVFLLVLVLSLSIALLLVLRAFRENIVFFYTPSEMPAHMQDTHLLRLGGLVENGSVQKEADMRVVFQVTDGAATLPVHYQGMLPALFREGQGVVAEGHMDADGTFNATRILAKHDENYMPKEVADKLRATGRWRGGGGR